MAHPEPFDWLAEPCHYCPRALRDCNAAPCDGAVEEAKSEAALSAYECSPQAMDPVAWASENRFDPEALADLELHDMLHPYGYGVDA